MVTIETIAFQTPCVNISLSSVVGLTNQIRGYDGAVVVTPNIQRRARRARVETTVSRCTHPVNAHSDLRHLECCVLQLNSGHKNGSQTDCMLWGKEKSFFFFFVLVVT